MISRCCYCAILPSRRISRSIFMCAEAARALQPIPGANASWRGASAPRALLDRLRGDAGVRPRQVRGYAVEEYTHLAVAATVASGMADAGFGIEAAAARHGLGFVPIASEEYLLACRVAPLKARPCV